MSGGWTTLSVAHNKMRLYRVRNFLKVNEFCAEIVYVSLHLVYLYNSYLRQFYLKEVLARYIQKCV